MVKNKRDYVQLVFLLIGLMVDLGIKFFATKNLPSSAMGMGAVLALAAVWILFSGRHYVVNKGLFGLLILIFTLLSIGLGLLLQKTGFDRYSVIPYALLAIVTSYLVLYKIKLQ